MRHAALAFALAFAASACAGSPPRASGSPQATTIAIPTPPAPSTAGPTPTPSPRLGAAVVENVQLIATGLQAPWAIDLAADGRLFITERAGRVRVVQLGPGGGLRPEPWATVPASTVRDGEKGLLGIALDPDFARTRFVYLYYSYTAPGGGTRNKLVRMRDENGRGVEETVLLDGIPGNANHDGGRVKFGPDGKIYVTTGDAENGANAQNAASLAGKILRVNRDGSVPTDNPTAGSPVWSRGHRNVQGIAWHPDTGALYATEHGPSNPFPDCCNDEVNSIVPGGNYGWPIVRGAAGDPRFQDPALDSGGFETWAPSGAAFATRPGPLRGSLIFATLRGQHLHRVVFAADGRTVGFREKLLTTQYGRLRDVYEIASGEFLVLTSNRDGRGLPVPDDDRVLLVTLR
ncbi:MAG TPA: PQQ-dependent sugar dehydrogenase [Candidatus Limnocylindria bacterium]|nr:PQQ-dependent sugar dehydrogenase [Candidatus Limnocylindria bacterium]